MVYVISYIVFGIVFGVLCHSLADKKGYEGYFWLGFFLGLVGLIYVASLPMAQRDESVAIQRPSSNVIHQPTRSRPTTPSRPKPPPPPIEKRCLYCGSAQRDSTRTKCQWCGKELS